VRQFLNAQRVGPIGMSEEKDADELEAEKNQDLPPLPPIPLQQDPSSGIPRHSQRPAGEWCRENGATPPPRSFMPGNGLAAESPESPGKRALRQTAAKDLVGAEPGFS